MTLRPLTALVLAALIGAGCSDDSSGGSTTSAARDAGTTFSACMRDHGVKEFPDPDASGELTIDAVVNGSSIDTDGPVWKDAIAACKDLQPAGFTGRKRGGDQQEQALRFAQCIRDNGVEDFPDPAAGEPLVNTNRIPSASTPAGMSALNAAMKTCAEHVADIVGGR